MTQSRRLTPVIALIALAALLLTLLGAAPADAGSERNYRVTITNLTNGQPMTPFVVATHSGSSSIFEVGSPASAGLQSLAENGGAGILAAELETNPRVGDVAVAGSAPFGHDESVYTDIVSTPGARKLSVAGMLICTNDGFGAIDSLQLNANGKTKVVYGFAYDAGTEINTEDYDDLVPPCDAPDGGKTGMSNPAFAENGVVHPHAGIQGGSDLTVETHGWSGAVIKVTIEPLS
jgi:Spondin_N